MSNDGLVMSNGFGWRRTLRRGRPTNDYELHQPMLDGPCRSSAGCRSHTRVQCSVWETGCAQVPDRKAKADLPAGCAVGTASSYPRKHDFHTFQLMQAFPGVFASLSNVRTEHRCPEHVTHTESGVLHYNPPSCARNTYELLQSVGQGHTSATQDVALKMYSCRLSVDPEHCFPQGWILGPALRSRRRLVPTMQNLWFAQGNQSN